MQPASSHNPVSNARAYLYALAILVGSRLVLFLALIFSVRFIPPSPMAAGEANLLWYQYLLRWDGGWYLQILRDGYSYNGNDLVQQSVNFNPLYPLLCKPLVLFGVAPGAALVIVSNLLIFIAVPLLLKLIREDYGDEVAYYALAALCFFPTSLFFSAGYTESLGLLLIVSFFLMLRRRRFILASLFVGLALATRLMSRILLPPLLWELWRAYSKDLRRLVRVGVVCLILATSGFWLYVVYLWAAFNRPQAIWTTKRAWHGSGGLRELFEVLTLQPFQHLADVWRVRLLPETIAPWFFLLFAVLFLVFRKLLPPAYSLYVLGALLMPYILSSGNAGFVSFTRYMMLTFPVFIIMGEAFKKRVWLGLTVVSLFAAMMFMYAALYAQAYWAG